MKDIPLGVVDNGSSAAKVILLRAPQAGTKIIDFSLHSSVADASSPMLSPNDSPDTISGVEEIHHTAVIPVLAPFDCVSTVSYRQAAGVSGSGKEAVVSTVIRTSGPRSVHVDSLAMEAKDGNEAKLRSCSLNNSATESFPQTWDQTSSFAVLSHFTLSSGHMPGTAGVQASSPAELLFHWRSVDAIDLTETIVALPPLTSPPQESFITARLVAPASVRLHTHFTPTIRITNAHPMHVAFALSIQADTAEFFVWHGSRLARLPEIPPGETAEVRLEMMAVGGTGWFALPTLKVYDGDGDRRSEVRVVSERGDNAERGKDGAVVLVRP